MKILFLFPHFLKPGGAANSVLVFAKGLQQDGYEVEILCANASSSFLEDNNDLCISQLKIPNSDSILYWLFLPFWQLKINSHIKSHKDCILFPQVLPSNWWAWLYKLTNKQTKIIWNCNEPSAFIHSDVWINAIPNPAKRIAAKILTPILKKIDIALEKLSDYVICSSNFSAILYEKAYFKKPLDIIYPPTQMGLYEPIQKKMDYIFTVGRLSKFKNTENLLYAFQKVSKDFPSYNLTIAGDGEEKANLNNLAITLGIQKRVKIIGKVNNDKLRELYENAKVTVICSVDEPFGLVPVESMMYSTPVIAHNSGGPKETIINAKTGYLYNNQSELVESLIKVICMTPTDYSEMQSNCKTQAFKFSSESSIIKLKEIIHLIKT